MIKILQYRYCLVFFLTTVAIISLFSSVSTQDNYGKIAYSSTRDISWEICVIDPDGKNQERLTYTPEDEFDPAWSPDGTKIAFGAAIEDENPEIYVIDSDGTNRQNLTNNSSWEFLPSWSPDGTKIAFASERDGNREIYAMVADGSDQTRLTNNPAYDSLPAWAPDGKRIAFVSKRGGLVDYEVYVMNADGSNQKNITNSPELDREPSWCCSMFSEPLEPESEFGYLIFVPILVFIAAVSLIMLIRYKKSP